MIPTTTSPCTAGILYLKNISIQWIYLSKLVVPLYYIHEIVISLTGDIHFIVQIGKFWKINRNQNNESHETQLQ